MGEQLRVAREQPQALDLSLDEQEFVEGIRMIERGFKLGNRVIRRKRKKSPARSFDEAANIDRVDRSFTLPPTIEFGPF